ncbi:hypothetical protein SOVF_012070 [Spinacia oleracea]|uniref:Subtilisin-like protease SBT1.2 n=1 Tax=Spinacia oleracea TaxID=3562 RepID=A0A9R0IG69_SPIOL|nr:subtilisin-like protease SBT1.2 [Spinacia oleracea]KNA24801.1 hypothetical protein SOVF_012070 [Spinacia oleracea]
MVSTTKTYFLFLSSVFLSLVSSLNALLPLQTYIVQLHPQSVTTSYFASKLDWHLSFLERTVSVEEEGEYSSRLLYSYSSTIEGFAALLSEPELETLKRMHGVIAVRPDRRLELHTTYSYKFLKLDAPGVGAWSRSKFGRGSIIGVLDTGVWPESPSFSDHGMPAPPKKWRGVCQQGQDFNSSSCNRKLIGARFFIKGHRVANSPLSPELNPEYVSPRDSSGHGTHTSSTAGGSPVQMASVLGNGGGIAQGMAPGAHVAVYKVCWFNGCYSSDVLAAMDVAIRDGVDVLSLSLGGFPIPFYDDTVAIGSFHAAEKGISVICAAGNNGPSINSVANEAPWVTTVGASTLDRRFPAYVRMGNGKYLYGESLFPGNHFPKAERVLEVVYAAGGDMGSEYCLEGSLSRAQVAGKMVVCDRGVNGRAEKGEVVKRAGGAAMILANTEVNLEEDSVDAHVLPATLIGYSESLQLKSYINSTKPRPTAKIHFLGTVTGRSQAPAVARFSSRGPSLNNPSILKPDVIAPGVNIIAAWPQNLGPTGLIEDSRRVNFTVMSGTSMACPHVSGIAALIHTAHPNWSPAAVKSAMMTTADVTDHYGKPIMDGNTPADHFAIGSGHINPAKAVDPGLVYDIRPADYITHLCSLGYTRSEIFTISRRNISCKEILHKSKGFSLNYPSVTAVFKGKETVKVINRSVTNVGRPNSIYSVEIRAPEGVRIVVKPKRLVFRRTNQTLGYRVYVIAKKGAKPVSSVQGELQWVHSRRNLYRVRSPITVSWVSKQSY